MSIKNLILVFLFASEAMGSQLNLENIFKKNLIPTDPVTSRRWGQHTELIETTSSEDNIIIEFIDPKTGNTNRSVDGKQILLDFQNIPGFKNIKISDLNTFQLSPGEDYLVFYLKQNYFAYFLDTRIIKRLSGTSEEKSGLDISPDGNYIAFVSNYNLWVSDLKDGYQRPLTNDGNPKMLNGSLDWVYQEEIFGRGDYKGFWWSPDSQKIAFLKTDESRVKQFPIVNHQSLYGELELQSYPKAGEQNPLVSIGVADIGGDPVTWVDLSKYQFEPYLVVGVGFHPDSSALMYQIQNRQQTWLDLNLYKIDAESNRTLFRESGEFWINRYQEAPVWSGHSFLWLSSESGYTHIYQYTLDSSDEVSQKTQVTSGNWSVKSLDGFDSSQDKLFFTANADSLLEDHFYEMTLGDSHPYRLTTPDRHHRIDLSTDHKFCIDYSESALTPIKKDLYTIADKSLDLVRNLFTPDISEINSWNLQEPKFFKVPTRDGFEMNAMAFFPKNFTEGKKYPVINYTYSGPGAQSVQNRFKGKFLLWHQFMANKGYLIWICDNRSASGDGQQSETGIYQNLGAQELEDLEDGLAFLREKSWVDEDKIALWGWSYGGYMTSYALSHCSSYQAGVAVAPVTDWRLYDSIYTERYMNTPQANIDGYHSSSVLEYADQMTKPFLLMHGIMDDNVHYQNSVQLAWKLQSNRNSDFEFVSYPLSKHGMNPQLHYHLFKKMSEFLDEHIGPE